jgi:hypothetical protein
MNRESSSDRLAFQIARTTISLNYPGQVVETPDREVLVVSADVPPPEGGNPNGAFQTANREINFIVGGR